MNCMAFAVLVKLLLCSAEEYTSETSDPDETLLLQTKVRKREIRRRMFPDVQHYHISIEGETVSMLQGHRGAVSEHNATVWTICAASGAGEVEEFVDPYGAEVDTGGSMYVYDEAGYVGPVLGFSAASMPDDACAVVVEAPGWYDSLNNMSLSTIEALDTSGISNAMLIDLPEVAPALQSAVQDEIRKTTQMLPHCVVLFHGSGAKSMGLWTPWQEHRRLILRFLVRHARETAAHAARVARVAASYTADSDDIARVDASNTADSDDTVVAPPRPAIDVNALANQLMDRSKRRRAWDSCMFEFRMESGVIGREAQRAAWPAYWEQCRQQYGV